MNSIYKYELQVTDTQEILMKKGAKILSVQTQDEKICIWALVDENEIHERRFFHIYGTGHQINPIHKIKFVGTCQLHNGGLVFHVFEPS